jgi:hypothetical protein
MDHFAGLDVSVKETSVCILDDASEEKREPVSDIDIAMADSLKVLDLKRPIREADVRW